ncbi:uncharacterized protein [Nicotiana tomentosiformis]|uniref:uncharacterized protein n=1 Tax=Nicotiana tomentosiformis TaxID=4098 RepID=UPI00388CA984
MSVREYSLQFDSLARYAPIVSNMEDRVHRFVMGLEPHLLNDCTSVSLQPDMDISRIQAYALGVEERKQKQRKDREHDTAQNKRARSLGPSSSTLSYVTPLVASMFGLKPELVKPFEVSTPVGDSVVAKRVYRGCIIVVHSRSTIADLIKLDMVELDVIMGMDWLASCHANVDCRSKIVRFQFPGVPVLEWKGYGSRVTNHSVHLVVNEFPDEFPEIEFAIDLLPDTHPISIPSYRMAPAKLKELKEQLKDLLEKGFIRPSILP